MFALGVLFLTGFASATIPDDCDPNMVAYWQMEGDATDSFGSHDGVWEGQDRWGSLIDGAAKFGNDSLISIADAGQVLDLHEGAFAIEFWVKASSSPPSYLLNKGNYQIRWIPESPTTGYIEATVNGVTVTPEFLDTDTPYHVVLTWLGAGEENLVLYVNNDLKDTATLLNPGSFADALEIGEGFVGLIDEVAIYDRWFDADDVEFHYKTSGGGRDYCYTAGAGNVSSTRTDFTLAGCALPGGGSISAGSCSRNGMYYCGNVSLILYDTLGINPLMPSNRGCAMEDVEFVEGIGMPQCCPSGYLCGDDLDTPESELICNLRMVDCVNITEQDECDEAGCFWLTDEGICVDNPLDYSCSIYKSETSCELDIWNVGKAGMGTEICGTYFVVSEQGYVIPQDSCKCDWTTPGFDTGKCVLGYDVVPDIYGTTANTFRCNKDFFAGACIDGLQQVTWEAGPTNINNWPGGVVPNDVLEAAGCSPNDVGIMRSCGEPIIKLPGFSLFALLSSLGIVGLVYLFKKE